MCVFKHIFSSALHCSLAEKPWLTLSLQIQVRLWYIAFGVVSVSVTNHSFGYSDLGCWMSSVQRKLKICLLFFFKYFFHKHKILHSGQERQRRRWWRFAQSIAWIGKLEWIRYWFFIIDNIKMSSLFGLKTLFHDYLQCDNVLNLVTTTVDGMHEVTKLTQNEFSNLFIWKLFLVFIFNIIM